jgi:hypothetical protein
LVWDQEIVSSNLATPTFSTSVQRLSPILSPAFHTLLPRVFFITILFSVASCDTKKPSADWPAFTNVNKPWTRWWWHGSALTREGITAELSAYSKAGLGGVEITPIYGVHGYEDKFVKFLSKEWIELLLHTLKEAKRLGLGVDMATGTGWPFGGPWVDERDACKNLYHTVYTLNAGQSLRKKIKFIQPPFLRALGSQVYEVHDNAEAQGRLNEGSRKEPLLKYDPANIKIDHIKQPVSANEDLQSLALDQVQFEKELPLVALIAYGSNGEVVDLTASVNTAGQLNWIAPPGSWKLYALFQGWHGKMVERAGPGGEGNVIDHFSRQALNNYLAAFDNAFDSSDLSHLRAFFNDSYEVDDARGAADWTPQLIEEFRKRRGYNLLDRLPALFGNDDPESNERVLYDYRITVGELLLGNFTQPWAEWAHSKKKIVRNQAHGAPANILDLYSAVDIPETEGVDPLRVRMATSAGHISNKQLISSESATWLDEHFLSTLGDIKTNIDGYLLSGVNHTFYHGTCYSPPGEAWPGWLFYAAVHLNPRNPQWNDFAALNRYITRCQSILQDGKPYNDILLYYPYADALSARGQEMLEHFDNPSVNFKDSPFINVAGKLLKEGYSFDFISDKQIGSLHAGADGIATPDDLRYRTLVIPDCKYMPIETLQKIASLIESGATIIFVGGLPDTHAGLAENSAEFEKLLKSMSDGHPGIRFGADVASLLRNAGILSEPMVSMGLSYTRRKIGDQIIYFVANNTHRFNSWLPLNESAKYVIIRDPMTSAVGRGEVRKKRLNGSGADGSEVYLTLQPGETRILELTNDRPDMDPFVTWSASFDSTGIQLTTWDLQFTNGGPVLPRPVHLDSAASWTSLSQPDFENFSGTGVYTTSFTLPGNSDGWLLTLGDVYESATVFLNGDSIATLIAPPFNVVIDDSHLRPTNKLEVRVSNLMANRISDLDKRGIHWKKFYNVNFPSRKPENRVHGLFNSSLWKSLPSGLSGPVHFTPVHRTEVAH